MVFIIHGDGNYLFHDPRGQARRADQETLLSAIRVAEQNPQAEVFIFHQIPRKHAFLFFPRPDGRFYYYQHGQLIAKELYRRDQGQSRFDPEVDLYHRFHAEGKNPSVRLFFYFGHEIPEFGGAGYDASYSHRTFTVHDLAHALKRITPDSTKLDLAVLSTCFNGTPYTIAALAPYTRTIVASPENLHLSYFDLQPFERLSSGLQGGDMATFAQSFARHAFNRLTEDVQTAVTVAVYDVDRVQRYLYGADSLYDHTLSTLNAQPLWSIEHCDCVEDPLYLQPEMSDGVDVFYRAPRFGRLKHKRKHSGWECWRLLK
jgi:hypothetical protein